MLVILINIILFFALLAALIAPEKVLPFIPTSNVLRRVIAVAAYFVLWGFMAAILGPVDVNEIKSPTEAADNKKWAEHAAADSTRLAGDYFNPKNAKSTLELAARFSDLAVIAMQSDYKKEEITDSAVIRFANRNSNTALEKMANIQSAYRKQYAKLLGDELWRANIEVKLLNKGKTLELVGGIFASNNAIAEMQEKIAGTLRTYGFTRVQYRWVEYDEEYTYYDL